jgi:hypothetical protein
VSIPVLNPVARLRPALALLSFAVVCCTLANIEIWGMRQVGIRGPLDRLDPRFMLPTLDAGWVILREICVWLGGLAAAALVALSRDRGPRLAWTACALLLLVEAAAAASCRQLVRALDGDLTAQARALQFWLQLETPVHAVALMAAGYALLLRALTGALSSQLMLALATLGALLALAAPWVGATIASAALFVAATAAASAVWFGRRG